MVNTLNTLPDSVCCSSAFGCNTKQTCGVKCSLAVYLYLPQLVLVVLLLGIVDYCSVALNCRSVADILSIGNVLILPKLT